MNRDQCHDCGVTAKYTVTFGRDRIKRHFCKFHFPRRIDELIRHHRTVTVEAA